MIRRPPRSTRKESSAASDVYKRQLFYSYEFRDDIECLQQTPLGTAHTHSHTPDKAEREQRNVLGSFISYANGALEARLRSFRDSMWLGLGKYAPACGCAGPRSPGLGLLWPRLQHVSGPAQGLRGIRHESHGLDQIGATGCDLQSLDASVDGPGGVHGSRWQSRRSGATVGNPPDCVP